MPCCHFHIKGRVQGVFYRASALEKAQQLGLTGWVRNLADGCVESLACGQQNQLQLYENWLRQGPDMARVDEVVVTNTQAHLFDGFEIRY